MCTIWMPTAYAHWQISCRPLPHLAVVLAIDQGYLPGMDCAFWPLLLSFINARTMDSFLVILFLLLQTYHSNTHGWHLQFLQTFPALSLPCRHGQELPFQYRLWYIFATATIFYKHQGGWWNGKNWHPLTFFLFMTSVGHQENGRELIFLDGDYMW